jgi:hypothetical protein
MTTEQHRHELARQILSLLDILLATYEPDDDARTKLEAIAAYFEEVSA